MGAGKPSQPPEWAVELLRGARVARLGLLDRAGAPRVLPVTFAVAEGRIWSAVDRKRKQEGKPARVGFLRRDPRAAVTVDRYSDDWTELAWVQVLGSVAVLEVEDAHPGIEALSAKYEQYRAGAPPGPVIALDPRRWLWWRAAGD